ncbi:MAG: cell division protein FtsX [Saprospiraceae bacterium]
MARSKPTYISAIASVALVLFMVGFFALTALHARKLVALFKEKVDIWLELRPDARQTDVSRIIAGIRQQPFVKKETVTFITREQAVAQMKADLGDTALIADLPNMLRDVVRFNVEADFLSPDSLASFREMLRRDTLISDLHFEQAETGNIGRNIEKLGWLTLTLGFLLIFAAIALIHNTIRLALFSNRFLIKNQELVGASWEFISRPYIRRGILNGFWSALLAIALLIGLLTFSQRQMPELEDLEDVNGMLAVFAGLTLLGVLISGLSTYWVVKKFLRMRVDDLY